MPSAKLHPLQATAVLCGLRFGEQGGKKAVESSTVSKFLKDWKLDEFLVADPSVSQIGKIVKDKNDPFDQLAICFLNCKNQVAAMELVSRIQQRKPESKELGAECVKFKLQSVLKKDLKSLDWSAFTEIQTKVCEGKVINKKNTACTVQCSDFQTKVTRKLFEDQEWSSIKKGTLLQLELMLDSEQEQWIVKEATVATAESALRTSSTSSSKSSASTVANDSDHAGRVLTYRMMCLLLEVTPKLLSLLFLSCWKKKHKKAWGEKDGKDLWKRMTTNKKKEEDFKKLGLSKIQHGLVDTWDVSAFATIFRENANWLDINKEAQTSVDALRKRRNSFAHGSYKGGLSQEEYDSKWKLVMKDITSVASMIGPDANVVLSETSKIQNLELDPQKEVQYHQEFQNLRGEIDHLQNKQASLEGKQDVMAEKLKQLEEKVANQGFQASSTSSTQNASNIVIETNKGGRYELFQQRKLGNGASGSVYKAQDLNSKGNQLVAIKICPREARSDREAQNLDRIQHKNVVTFFGQGKHPDGIAIVMQLVVGQSYDKYLKQHGPLRFREAAEHMRQVIAGLKAVHDAKITHRDIKPANLMRKKDGTMIIVDFGLSKQKSQATVTVAQGSVGTPAYMSPEQAESTLGTVGPPSDVFAVGVVWYESLTTLLPFGSEKDQPTSASLDSQYKTSAYMTSLVEQDPRPVGRGVPALFEDFLLRKCLAKKIPDRFATADTLLSAWDKLKDEIEKEEASIQVSASVDKFWGQFKQEDYVTYTRFKEALKDEDSTLSNAHLDWIVSEIDVDGDECVSKAEFFAFSKGRDLQDVLLRAKDDSSDQTHSSMDSTTKSSEPDGVYFAKKKEALIKYKSDSFFGGGSKEGSLELSNGFLVCRKSNGTEKYRFEIASVSASQSEKILIVKSEPQGGSAGRKADLSFASPGQCSEWITAITTTQKWQETDE